MSQSKKLSADNKISSARYPSRITIFLHFHLRLAWYAKDTICNEKMTFKLCLVVLYKTLCAPIRNIGGSIRQDSHIKFFRVLMADGHV